MAKEMKDSGIEWIGEIPAEWEIRPAKYSFSEVREKNTDGKITNALKFFSGSIIRKLNFDADSDDYVAETITNYTIVMPDTIMINGLNLNYDLKSLRVGLVTEIGIITSAYLALKPDTTKISPKFATYLFKGYETKMAFHNMGAGIRKTLGYKEFKIQPVLYPSLPEQEKISAYLDSECAKIDDVITKTKATIEEYKKLKQSVITEAVTKGIRPNREMKDSGIVWIGEIPREWEISRTKYIASSMYKGNGITKEDVVENGDTPCVRYGEIYTKYNYSFDSCKTRTDIAKINPPQYFSYGDILFVCTGELVEEIGKNIVYLGNEKCLAGGDIIVMHHNQEPRYLNYALGCSIAQTQKSCGKSKLKVVHISASEIGNIITFLPDFEEQQEIADYLDKKCSEIDTLIAKKEQIVTELESYKKSLIYEYVTGKREVCDMNEKEEIITIFDPQATRLMQEALVYKVIKHSGDDLKGRIHLMKMIFILDIMLGLNLGINYLRYNHGPYNPIIESIEDNLSDRGIISVRKDKKTHYSVVDDSFEEKYNEHFAQQNSEIEKIIDYMKRMKASRAEKIATLYAAWNDMIIDGVQNITDEMIIDDVMNNWTENKANTDFSTWQRILNEMKDKKIIPRGYGKHTSRKSE